MARAIIVNLPPAEYRRLAERAEASDRDPHQEARHLIRQGIGSATFSQQTPAGGAVVSPSAAPATGPAREGSE